MIKNETFKESQALSQKGLLVLRGVADDGLAKVVIQSDGGIKLIMSGGCDLMPHLQKMGWALKTVLLGPTQGEASYQISVPTVMLNEIADADTHRVALTAAVNFCRNFPSIYCINNPQQVLANTRDAVYKTLKDIDGLVLPKTIRHTITSPNQLARIMAAEFEGPVIVRPCGSHQGRLTRLISDVAKLEPLNALPLDGREYYLTAFHDYISPDRCYRKYRFIVIDGEVFLGHLLFSRNWMVHEELLQQTSANESLLAEKHRATLEFETSLKPLIAARCKKASDSLGLDAFAIDAALLNSGELLIFEANANQQLLGAVDGANELTVNKALALRINHLLKASINK